MYPQSIRTFIGRGVEVIFRRGDGRRERAVGVRRHDELAEAGAKRSEVGRDSRWRRPDQESRQAPDLSEHAAGLSSRLAGRTLHARADSRGGGPQRIASFDSPHHHASTVLLDARCRTQRARRSPLRRSNLRSTSVRPLFSPTARRKSWDGAGSAIHAGRRNGPSWDTL